MKLWTPDEIEYLNQTYYDFGTARFRLKFPHRTRFSVMHKVKRLGLTTKLRNAWTKQETDYLVQTYAKRGSAKFREKYPDRVFSSIQRKVFLLGLKTNEFYWSKRELDVIRKYYSNHSVSFVCNKLGNRTYGAVTQKARKIGVGGLRKRVVTDSQKKDISDKLKEGYKTGRIKHHQKGKLRTPEEREKISSGLEEGYRTGRIPIAYKGKKRPDSHVKNILKASHVRPNNFEIAVEKWLDKNEPKQWKYVGDGKVIINGHCPDFVNVNGKKEVILANGVYWHTVHKGIKTKQQAERKEKKSYEEMGFSVRFVWEDDFMKTCT